MCCIMTDKQFQRKLNRIKKRGERYKQEKELKDTYVDYLPERKKRKVSNIMIVVIVVAIVAYTVASFWIQYRTGMPVDSTLTTLYYSFWTTELIAITTIKNYKTKHGINSNSSNDEAQG